MNLLFQGLVFSLTAAFLYHACLDFGVRNAMLFLLLSLTVSFAAEWTAIRWGWISGYSYHPALVPRVGGVVPVCVLLLWFVISYTACVLFRPIIIREGGSFFIGRFLGKALLCSLYVVAADLFLDPMGVHTGLWIWDEPGPYFGTPFGNFAFWLLVGLAICGSYLFLEKPLPHNVIRERIIACAPFVIFSILLTVLCLVGCILLIRSSLPPLLTLSVMVPCWIYWVIGARRVRCTGAERIGVCSRIRMRQ